MQQAPSRHSRHPHQVMLRRLFHSASYSRAKSPVPQDTPRQRVSVPAIARGSAPAAAASASGGAGGGEGAGEGSRT